MNSNIWLRVKRFSHSTFCLITDKEGKAVHLGYAEKCSLVALTQQVTHGPYDPVSSPPVGVLDVVGKDRRYVNEEDIFLRGVLISIKMFIFTIGLLNTELCIQVFTSNFGLCKLFYNSGVNMSLDYNK